MTNEDFLKIARKYFDKHGLDETLENLISLEARYQFLGAVLSWIE